MSGSVPIPLLVRLPIAVVVITWAAIGDRRWALPIGVLLAMPVIWWGSFAILTACVALRRTDIERRLFGLAAERYAPGMLILDEPIRTERLILRALRSDDLDAIHAFDGRTDVVRYLHFEVRDREASRANLERMIGQRAIRAPGDRVSLAVELAATHELIGDVVLEWAHRTSISRVRSAGCSIRTTSSPAAVTRPRLAGCSFASHSRPLDCTASLRAATPATWPPPGSWRASGCARRLSCWATSWSTADGPTPAYAVLAHEWRASRP